MVKGYYIVPDMRSSEIGVNKKFEYHINEFSKVSEVQMIRIPENRSITRIMMRLPIGASGCDYRYVKSKIIDPDYIYIRKKDMDRKLIDFLKSIKMQYPKCKVLFEIPTFPYDKDGLNKWYNAFIILKDRIYRTQIAKYVDRIVTYSDDDKIFNCQTIRAHNGVDCAAISPVSDYYLNADAIRLIAVARFRQHHGYERIIRGLGDYYKNGGQRIVTLALIGDGDERAMYEETCRECNVEEYVHFLGSMQGQELDDQYNRADIAVSSLGMYKLGLENVSTLKNCEYISKGLPIITAFHDCIFDGLTTVLSVPNDQSNISIIDLISFYDRVYAKGKKRVVEQNRNIALQRADLSQSYREVLDYIAEQ